MTMTSTCWVALWLAFFMFRLLTAINIAIIYSEPPDSRHNGCSVELFAAKEVKRYLYLTQNAKTVLLQEPFDHFRLNSYSKIIIIATKNSSLLHRFLPKYSPLKAEIYSLVGDEHLLVTILGSVARDLVFCVGATPIATLYAAYLFVEQLGVRFTLHSDIIPAAKSFSFLQSFSSCLHIRASPKFEIRGIQPFHDFPEGPDWWGEQEYKAHITQMAKLRMNFIGVHTYPLYEPTVWVGLTSDFNPNNGTVTYSYPTSYQNTLRGDWGYLAKNTSQYHYGNWALFPRDCYGVDILQEYCPWPTSLQANNNVFYNVGMLLNSAFTYARALGIKTCVGTEVPLKRPPNPPHSKEEYYKGIFSRIAHTYPVDYYWLWTSEDWEWNKVNVTDPVVSQAVDDFMSAYNALKKVNGNFSLATCGWVLGPIDDRAYFDKILPNLYTLSSIDMNVGWSPVDRAYAQITRHKKWVIPWMEDDPGLTAPQLWVNRTLLHGLDAVKYGASGLLGIHWRTLGISPQIGALALFPWNPQLTSREYWLDFAKSWFGTDIASDAVAILDSVDSFKMPRPVQWTTGPGSFVPISDPWSSVKLQYSFVDKWLALRPKVKGLANLERFDYWANTFEYMRSLAKMECTWGVYNANMQKVLQEQDLKKRQQLARQLALPARIELVRDWSTMMTFLQQTIFSTGELGTLMNVEQHNMPTVLTTPELLLEAALVGDSNPPTYIGCYIDEQNRDLNGISFSDNNMSPELCQIFCRKYQFCGVQYSSYCFCGNSYGHYGKAPEVECNMPCTGNPKIKCGGNWRNSIYHVNQNLTNVLPIEARPNRSYLGPTRLIVPTIRTAIRKTETFVQTAMVLSAYPPSIQPTLHLRPMGSTQPFTSFIMKKIANHRQVWSVYVSQNYTQNDFEYYIDVTVNEVEYRIFPVTAPTECQTVVVW